MIRSCGASQQLPECQSQSLSLPLHSLVSWGMLLRLISSLLVSLHFSTGERCMQAIKEMACIWRIGGQIMIYVWAVEHKQRFEKQDVFVPWSPSPPSCSSGPPGAQGIHKSIFRRTYSWIWTSPALSGIGLERLKEKYKAHPAEGRKAVMHGDR